MLVVICVQVTPLSSEYSNLVFPVVPHFVNAIVCVEHPINISLPFGDVIFVKTVGIVKITLLTSEFEV